jgi:membrane protease YdiL (CAAX protease family)
VIRVVSRHPTLFSVVAVLVPVAGLKLLGASVAYLRLTVLTDRLIIEAVFCAYVILLLAGLGWWHEAGFRTPTTRRKLLAYLPLVCLPVAVVATSGFKAAHASQVVGFATFTVMVGFAEEGLLRGVVLRALLPGGMMRAAILSSLLFGIGHLLNIWQGASPATTVVQVLYSTLLGIGFAGARLYSGTIWPAIAVHAFTDFVDVASRGFVLAPPQSLTLARALVPIVVTGLYAVYGGWLVRRTAIRIEPTRRG